MNNNEYITRSEFELFKQDINHKIEAMNNRFADLDKSITRQFSFWGVLTVLTALAITVAIFAVPIVAAHL